ncbi:AAA family ATPase [Pseudomonas aeruginosa]|nr:AAA family ATPase [Pseudomonas aeruginosa]
MQITKLTLHRFKKYRDKEISIKPGLSLFAGPNNAGKTTILQAFRSLGNSAKLYLRWRKAALAFGKVTLVEGLGMGADDFLVINTPSLKHLWTNLNTQRDSENDGYTLWIKVDWTDRDNAKHLTIGLSLANDRIFIKTISSNIQEDEKSPNIAYIPPLQA